MLLGPFKLHVVHVPQALHSHWAGLSSTKEAQDSLGPSAGSSGIRKPLNMPPPCHLGTQGRTQVQRRTNSRAPQAQTCYPTRVESRTDRAEAGRHVVPARKPSTQPTGQPCPLPVSTGVSPTWPNSSRSQVQAPPCTRFCSRCAGQRLKPGAQAGPRADEVLEGAGRLRCHLESPRSRDGTVEQPGQQ